MNPEQSVSTQPTTPASAQAEQVATVPPSLANANLERRPRGKIARLPASVREKLNQMMDEGLTYPEIISALSPDAAAINEVNMSRWYKTGHQDWLKNQLWLEETRSRLHLAIDVIGENEGSNVHQANLHVAATQLIQSLVRSGEALLTNNPEEYVCLVNSISRLSREALNFQKYREACAMARAEVSKLLDPDRKLSEKETLAIVGRLDEILGFK